jgi:hypothetical protein
MYRILKAPVPRAVLAFPLVLAAAFCALWFASIVGPGAHNVYAVLCGVGGIAFIALAGWVGFMDAPMSYRISLFIGFCAVAVLYLTLVAGLYFAWW